MKKLIFHFNITIFLVIILSGCAEYEFVTNSQYQTHPHSNYPVGIVSANFLPQVNAVFLTEGKSEGATKGIGEGMLSCARTGDALGFIFCLPFGAVFGGTMGAYNAEDSKKIDRIKRNLKEKLGTANEARNALTQNVYQYYKNNKNNIRVEIVHNTDKSTSNYSKSSYSDIRLKKYASLLELQMLAIKFEGAGNKDDHVCLEMSAKGRKIDTKTQKVLDELTYKQSLGCRKPSHWFENDGKPIINSINDGYKLLAENLVDELYFIYKPKEMNKIKHNMSKRVVPYFALSPIYPPIAFKSDNLKYKYYIRWNGISFTDVNSLYPTFQWEPFPRNFDYIGNKNNKFSNISYDLRIYEYEGKKYGSVKAIHLYGGKKVYEKTGIRQSSHKLKTKLKPCQWYRWTVRANFKLNGTWRTTEWTGTYNSAGGLGGTDQSTLIKYYPSEARRKSNSDSMFKIYVPITDAYLPFRTPSLDNKTCLVK